MRNVRPIIGLVRYNNDDNVCVYVYLLKICFIQIVLNGLVINFSLFTKI